jgi:hypothetical protein
MDDGLYDCFYTWLSTASCGVTWPWNKGFEILKICRNISQSWGSLLRRPVVRGVNFWIRYSNTWLLSYEQSNRKKWNIWSYPKTSQKQLSREIISWQCFPKMGKQRDMVSAAQRNQRVSITSPQQCFLGWPACALLFKYIHIPFDFVKFVTICFMTLWPVMRKSWKGIGTMEFLYVKESNMPEKKEIFSLGNCSFILRLHEHHGQTSARIYCLYSKDWK